jgi:hypothetical protein
VLHRARIYADCRGGDSDRDGYAARGHAARPLILEAR